MNMKGEVLNDAERDVGDVVAGDEFLRNSSKKPPTRALSYRYFGTVNPGTSESVTGWIKKEKLDEAGTICK
ncbi:hypothetical protein ETD83_41975 [Actinomadura soli]|uniref:Uncharacterized protein n=1 Tax=Actinomadura soli TaxID=2508997 RepID=A0A5C4IXS3_9ACTN|nr:hypothetical protein ETD83_41975 [Actinomadura soli]